MNANGNEIKLLLELTDSPEWQAVKSDLHKLLENFGISDRAKQLEITTFLSHYTRNVAKIAVKIAIEKFNSDISNALINDSLLEDE